MPILDVRAQFVTEDTRHLAVRFQRNLVDVYFPADTTRIGALRCCTLEIIIKIRLSKNHKDLVQFIGIPSKRTFKHLQPL